MIRLGFVSNSSSSSFTLHIPMEELECIDIDDILMDEYEENSLALDVAHSIFSRVDDAKVAGECRFSVEMMSYYFEYVSDFMEKYDVYQAKPCKQ